MKKLEEQTRVKRTWLEINFELIIFFSFFANSSFLWSNHLFFSSELWSLALILSFICVISFFDKNVFHAFICNVHAPSSASFSIIVAPFQATTGTIFAAKYVKIVQSSSRALNSQPPGWESHRTTSPAKFNIVSLSPFQLLWNLSVLSYESSLGINSVC